MNDEQINHAIDQAVRELLDVEPRADLRARVIAGIDGSAAASGWKLRVVAPASAALIAIGAVAVLVAPWRSGAPPLRPTLAGHSRPAPIPRAIRPDGSAARALPSHGRVERPEPSRGGRSGPPRAMDLPVVAASLDSPDHSGVAPLDPITPIRVAAVSASDIAPRPIAIEPLAPITRLQIAPLTPPDGRD